MFKTFLIMLTVFFLSSGVTFAKDILPKIPTDDTKIKNLLVHKHTENCKLTTAEPVQIICILDRSGSMSSLTEDTIGGYNSFIEKQKKESGEAEVTTILFDNQYEKITDAVNLNEVKKLTSAEYYARGTTALLDAVGMTITDIFGKMERENICPAKRRVIVMIMTDGLENASKEYNKSTVKSLIENAQENYKWNFIFMGANIDSAAEANSIGIKSDYAADYSHDEAGVSKSFEMMDNAVGSMRKKGSVDKDWKK